MVSKKSYYLFILYQMAFLFDTIKIVYLLRWTFLHGIFPLRYSNIDICLIYFINVAYERTTAKSISKAQQKMKKQKKDENQHVKERIPLDHPPVVNSSIKITDIKLINVKFIIMNFQIEHFSKSLKVFQDHAGTKPK